MCDKHWTKLNSQVICQQLGYTFLSTDYNVPSGKGPILMSNVNCRSGQTNLLACAHSGFGNHDCGHVEDVGIQCSSQDYRKSSSHITMTSLTL